MKKSLIICIILLIELLQSIPMQSQKSLYVDKKNGTQQSFLISQIQKVSFPSGNIVIKNLSGNESTILLSEICVLMFKTNTNVLPQLVNDNNIKIFPNPTSDNLTIESEDEIQQIILFDLQGRISLQILPQNRLINICLTNYNKGLYLLRIVTSRGNVIRKIIVN